MTGRAPKSWLAALLFLSAGAVLYCSETAFAQTSSVTNTPSWDEQFQAGINSYLDADHSKAIEHFRNALDAARPFDHKVRPLKEKLEVLARQFRNEGAQTEADAIDSLVDEIAAVIGSGHEEEYIRKKLEALAYVAKGEFEKAEAILKEVFEEAKRAYGPRGGIVSFHASDVGNFYLRRGRHSDAESVFRQGLNDFLLSSDIDRRAGDPHFEKWWAEQEYNLAASLVLQRKEAKLNEAGLRLELVVERLSGIDATDERARDLAVSALVFLAEVRRRQRDQEGYEFVIERLRRLRDRI